MRQFLGLSAPMRWIETAGLPKLIDAINALSPIALWEFNEVSGTTLVDSKGSYNGTITGTPTYQVQGLDLSASSPKTIRWPNLTSAYNEVAHNAAFDNGYSVAALVKKTTPVVGSIGAIFHKGYTSQGGQWGHFYTLSDAGSLSCTWYNGAWNTPVFTKACCPVEPHLYVFTWDGGTNRILYPGQNSPYTWTGTAFLNNTSPLRIARRKDNTNQDILYGSVDAFAWINRVITQAEVDTLFNCVRKFRKGWDYYNVNAGVTITEWGRKVVHPNDGSTRGIFGVNSRKSGKWFLSFTMDALGNSGDWAAGLATVTAATTSALNGTGKFCYRDNGQAWKEAVLLGTYTALSVGSKLSVAVDIDAGKIWFGVNDTWVNSGNPAAGTNPTITITAGTPLFAMHNSDNAAGAVEASIYTDTANGLTVPAGFSLWEGDFLIASGVFNETFADVTAWTAQTADITRLATVHKCAGTIASTGSVAYASAWGTSGAYWHGARANRAVTPQTNFRLKFTPTIVEQNTPLGKVTVEIKNSTGDYVYLTIEDGHATTGYADPFVYLEINGTYMTIDSNVNTLNTDSRFWEINRQDGWLSVIANGKVLYCEYYNTNALDTVEIGFFAYQGGSYGYYTSAQLYIDTIILESLTL